MPTATVTRYYHQLRGRDVPARAALLGARSLSRVRDVRPADVEWIAAAVRTLSAHQLGELAGELAGELVPPTYADFGSVSSGTMRPEDLIPALSSALADLDRAGAHATLLRDCEAYESQDQDESDPEGDVGSELVDELFSALEEFAPPFGHFGAHEGDGADYGFWLSHDSLTEAERCGELVKVDAGADWPQLAADVEYVLEVNDHGNCTLYDRTHREVWALV